MSTIISMDKYVCSYCLQINSMFCREHHRDVLTLHFWTVVNAIVEAQHFQWVVQSKPWVWQKELGLQFMCENSGTYSILFTAIISYLANTKAWHALSFSLNFENTSKNYFHTVCCLFIHCEELLPLLAVLAKDLQYYNIVQSINGLYFKRVTHESKETDKPVALKVFNTIDSKKTVWNRLYMDQCHFHI